jgi:hypothetical protein
LAKTAALFDFAQGKGGAIEQHRLHRLRKKCFGGHSERSEESLPL